MAVTVRPVRTDDEAEIDRIQALYEETELAGDPDASLYTRAEYAGLLRSRSEEFANRFVVAQDGGELLGSGLFRARRAGSSSSVHARVWVPPRHARRGAGSALADDAVRWARSLGRTVVTTEVDLRAAGSDDALAFAARRGFAVAQVEEERRLALPSPEGHWTGLAAEAAPHHPGYDIVTVTGPIPEELAQGYCDVYNHLVLDAPQGGLEVSGATDRTPADVAAQDQEIHGGGGVRYTGFALLGGQVVGFCCVVATAGARHLSQYSTIVDRAHRGHRLGLALKVAAYAAAEAAHPERAYVSTWNADDNAPMIAVNVRMGFELHGATATLQKRL